MTTSQYSHQLWRSLPRPHHLSVGDSCGLCVCMLNTVINPMLNLLGGGGNRRNQLVADWWYIELIGGTTPLLAGVLRRYCSANTSMRRRCSSPLHRYGSLRRPLIVVAVPEQTSEENVQYDHSPRLPSLRTGVIGIFFYVGVEIGIPAQLIFYISSMDLGAASVGGAFAAVLLVAYDAADSSAHSWPSSCSKTQ